MAQRNFTKASTVDDVLKGIDLCGKHAVITGASGGLGEESARGLSAAGASVTIVARDVAKAQAVVDRVRVKHPSGGAVDVMSAELSDVQSVRSFGKAWIATGRRIDILILNAGIMACPLERTKEGWEMQFATNHLGHFLLTSLLAPSLATGARVVAVSSAAHEFAPVDFTDVNFLQRTYTPWTAYGQSKTANVLFALGLDERLRRRDIRAFSLHPGMIPTELGRHMNGDSMLDMQRLQKQLAAGAGQEHATKDKPKQKQKMEFKTVQSGAATQVWAATAPELQSQGGAYCNDCQVSQAKHWAFDPVAVKTLWDLSEQLLGCTFPVDVLAAKL